MNYESKEDTRGGERGIWMVVDTRLVNYRHPISCCEISNFPWNYSRTGGL